MTGPAVRADDAALDIDGAKMPFRQLPLSASYVHPNGEPEVVVPVRWIKTVPSTQAVWEKGMFANQNSACKLRNRFTLDRLLPAFGLDE